MKRPRDLGNDTFSIRTEKDGIVNFVAITAYPKLDLKCKDCRKQVRRFANRLLEMCDWWESK
jgi:hypothetical protein